MLRPIRGHPPPSIADIGGRPLNDLNHGIETLAACLSTRKRDGPFFQLEGALSNVDGDSADRNLTDWAWGDHGLREYMDSYGFVLIYFHGKDFAKPKKDMVRYRFSVGGEEFEVAPETNPASKTYSGAGRFQLRSVGKDGKPGTADDVRPE